MLARSAIKHAPVVKVDAAPSAVQQRDVRAALIDNGHNAPVRFLSRIIGGVSRTEFDPRGGTNGWLRFTNPSAYEL
jgi:hypothetical protein